MANIFTKISDSIANHRRERMSKDIMEILKTQFGFNAMAALLPKSLTEQETYINVKVVEHLVWYVGNGGTLNEFYQSYKSNNTYDTDRQNFFWVAAPSTIRKCHTGLAREISIKQDTILFGNGFDLDAVVYKTSGEGINRVISNSKDEAKSKAAKELLEQFAREIGLRTILKKGSQANSWSGHIAIKLGMDFSLSAYPIPQIYDRRYFDIVAEKGITKSIIFHNYLKLKKDENKEEVFRHDEVYSTTKQGYGIIKNVLVHIKNNQEQVVSWDKAQVIFPQFEGVDEEFVSKTKGMLAFDLPNIVSSNVDSNDPYGVSDYEAAISAFDVLDECYSALPRELRDKRFIRFLPKTMVRRDENGTVIKDDFTSNFLLTEEDPNVNNGRKFDSPVDETENHIKKYNAALTRAINLCGLSPQSLGITGLDALNSSDATIREKTRATLETRNAKLELWKPFVEKVLVRVLSFTSELQKMNSYPHSAGIPKVDLEWDNLDVTISFNDYIQSSMDEKYTMMGNAKANGLTSIENAISYIHQDWTDEQVLMEVNRIKFEQGMDADNPELLQLEEQDNEEDDE